MSNQGSNQPSSGPSRHERRKQETRDRIRSAAAELFGAQGVQGTKVSEICDRADIAHQTFFNHFPSKRDLLVELSQAGNDFLTAAMDSACEGASSTRERLLRFLETMRAATEEVGPMHRELMTEVMYASQEVHGEERARRIHDAFEQLIRCGQRDGDVTRRHSLDVLVQLSVGAFYVLMSDWAGQPDFDIDRCTREMTNLLTECLARRPGED